MILYNEKLISCFIQQYDDAIKAHKDGRDFDYDSLHVPEIYVGKIYEHNFDLFTNWSLRP